MNWTATRARKRAPYIPTWDYGKNHIKIIILQWKSSFLRLIRLTHLSCGRLTRYTFWLLLTVYDSSRFVLTPAPYWDTTSYCACLTLLCSRSILQSFLLSLSFIDTASLQCNLLLSASLGHGLGLKTSLTHFDSFRVIPFRGGYSFIGLPSFP